MAKVEVFQNFRRKFKKINKKNKKLNDDDEALIKTYKLSTSKNYEFFGSLWSFVTSKYYLFSKTSNTPAKSFSCPKQLLELHIIKPSLVSFLSRLNG